MVFVDFWNGLVYLCKIDKFDILVDSILMYNFLIILIFIVGIILRYVY